MCPPIIVFYFLDAVETAVHRHLCLQNKHLLQKHTLRLSNLLPPKISVHKVNNGSGSACKINT